jgi:ligand-binding SRPBCC domain-containing protein
MTIARYSSRCSATPASLFAFHCDVANLPRISPPIPKVAIRNAASPTREGDLQHFTLGIGSLRIPWEARIARLVDGQLIEDIQERGPFRSWRHQHRIAPEGDGSKLTDTISFRLLPTIAGEFVEFWTVRPALIAMLAWRHRRTRQLIEGRD